MVNYKAKPFYLTDEKIKWVEDTLKSLTLEEKVGQIFCITADTFDPVILGNIIKKIKPGSFMFRPNPAKDVRAAYEAMQKNSNVPLLFPANLEAGGNGVALEGTYFGKPMGVSATGNIENARRLGYVCAKEGAAVGCTWSFGPVVDIDLNWRNPITNVRTFGSDVDQIIKMAKGYMQGVKDAKEDFCVCVKHFPGDGVDERDQHLLPTVNSLTYDQWIKSYGRIYKELINEGAETIMVGHFIAPHLVRKYCPEIKDEDILPASTNKYIMTDLLRKELGFNGVISTDATPMVGFSGTLTRDEAIRKAVAGGADIILFTKNEDEDYQSVLNGVKSGEITLERIDDAVRRILALKAYLNLDKIQQTKKYVPELSRLEILGNKEHVSWSREVADQAITLVKDNQKLLPLSPNKTKRIRLTVIGENNSGAFGDAGAVTLPLKQALENAGFEVSLYDYKTLEHMEIFTSGVADMKKKFDLSLVVANVQTGSNNTSRRIDWITLMAANEPWYTREIPTMFISFANPYHLIDVPFISTFINCYTANQETIECCVEKLLGKSEFKGKSPVDVTCGNVWGAKWM